MSHVGGMMNVFEKNDIRRHQLIDPAFQNFYAAMNHDAFIIWTPFHPGTTETVAFCLY
jgi:hypothetical protein